MQRKAYRAYWKLAGAAPTHMKSPFFVPDNTTRHRNRSVVLYCSNAKIQSSQSQTAELPCRWENHEWTKFAQAQQESLKKFLIAAWAVREKFFSTVFSYKKYNFRLFHCVQPTKIITLLVVKNVPVSIFKACISFWWGYYSTGFFQCFQFRRFWCLQLAQHALSGCSLKHGLLF